MSKERKRRREEREAAAVATPTPSRRPKAARPARTQRKRPKGGGALTRHRRQQDVLLALCLLAGNGLLWTQVHSWPLRVVALVVTAALWPIIVTVVFDRRSS